MGCYTRQELEQLFEKTYHGKFCSLELPGQVKVYGIVDSIAVDHNGILIIAMQGKRNECSLEEVNTCFKVISDPKAKINLK